MKRVLLVEDDVVLARGMVRSLESHVQIVGVATTVPEALQHLEDDPVDVVVTDYQLSPDRLALTGLDLARIVRDRWTDVVVILASGSLDDGVRNAGCLLGVHAFLEKPFEMARLLAEIHRDARR
jgi:CheY-like chemotaxis protein